MCACVNGSPGHQQAMCVGEGHLHYGVMVKYEFDVLKMLVGFCWNYFLPLLAARGKAVGFPELFH